MLSNAENEKSPVNRRSFLRNAGATTAAVAALGFAAPKSLLATTPSATPSSPDTPAQIFTAALVAEDLAVTFYYNGLIGKVIEDVNLAGPGGDLHHPANGSPTNVGYLRGALREERTHSDLFRVLLGRPDYNVTGDPYTKFYFPTGCFDTLDAFVGLLSALENAFIAAYMAAVQEFALMAAQGKPLTIDGVTYKPTDFVYYAGIASSILGVESEHRALGRAIPPNLIPANQLDYEQQNGIYTVYNGSTSAVAALLPFLSPGKGLTEYDFLAAYKGCVTATNATYGSIPTQYFK